LETPRFNPFMLGFYLYSLADFLAK
jgi:hypothetical protein